ncbi:MAG TPA: cysteine desulfurase family protein [Candidatus Eisenbacteria bacterium]|nr:cysteine desulfurase family protein [Candidatus Eisenbacteria bacterium]
MPVYLDYNATTPLRPEALTAMMPFLEGRFGNPSSTHALGREARRAVELARRDVLELCGTARGEILFTSSGTEAVLLGVAGAARALRARGQHVIVSAVEHSSGLEAARLLEAEGFSLSWVIPDAQGRIAPERVMDLLRPDTILVSIQHANNETGVVQPIGEIGSLLSGTGTRVHVDAVQSAGKIPLDPDAWHAAYVSLAAHKLGGPKGVGVLWRAEGSPLLPLLPGTGERGLRGGTSNVSNLVGFGVAARLARCELEAHAMRLTVLREAFETSVAERIPSAAVTGRNAKRLPNTTHLTFDPGVGGDLVIALDREGYAVSAGSACRSGSEEPSPVLLAMGMSPERARTALRVSLGRETTSAELEGFVSALRRIVEARLALSEH